MVYASEAEVVNLAVFWSNLKRMATTAPGEKGSIRDYASMKLLIILANLESINALFDKKRFNPAGTLDTTQPDCRSINEIPLTQPFSETIER